MVRRKKKDRKRWLKVKNKNRLFLSHVRGYFAQLPEPINILNMIYDYLGLIMAGFSLGKERSYFKSDFNYFILPEEMSSVEKPIEMEKQRIDCKICPKCGCKKGIIRTTINTEENIMGIKIDFVCKKMKCRKCCCNYVFKESLENESGTTNPWFCEKRITSKKQQPIKEKTLT